MRAQRVLNYHLLKVPCIQHTLQFNRKLAEGSEGGGLGEGSEGGGLGGWMIGCINLTKDLLDDSANASLAKCIILFLFLNLDDFVQPKTK